MRCPLESGRGEPVRQTGLVERLRQFGARLGANRRARGEIGWVIASKLGEYALQFVLLKILATRLGKDGYGEMNLAETAMILITHVALAPARESYLRDYHRSIARGSAHDARRFLLRWYAVATIAVVTLSIATADILSEAFQVDSATVVAAALVFFFDRWRLLAVDIANIERRRRAWAVWNLSFSSALVVCVGIAVYAAPATAATALFAYAGVTGLFALGMMIPWLRDGAEKESDSKRPSHLGEMTRRFGFPFALLLIFQWVQSFADRFLLKALLDPETVGLYVAAFRVCGVPFMLMLSIGHSLLTPIAYQRSGGESTPTQLWSADRLVLAGVGIHVAIGLVVVATFALIGPEVVVLLTSDEFVISTATVVALSVGRLLQTTSQALQPIFAVHERMESLFWLRLFGAVATLSICWPMIEAYGAFGAALGTLLAFSLYIVAIVFAPTGCFWFTRKARTDSKAVFEPS